MFVFSACLAVAQSASDETEEEAVQLNPFVVTTEAGDAWVSSQSVSGTRTRTEVQNLPMNMQVFTDSFIKDIAADDLIDVVTYSAGVSKNTGQGTFNEDNTNFTLRGHASFLPMRNGFRRLRLVNSDNIDRVEIIKGPASLLYGQLNPGGNINYITKRPVLKGQFADITLKAGSYDHYSAVVDYNAVISPQRLAFRMVNSYREYNKEGIDAQTVETLVNPSLTWWILPATTLTVEYEDASRNRNNWQSTLPFHNLVDITTVPWSGVDRTFTSGAKTDYYDVRLRTYTAELTHRFNRHFTLRANYTEEIWTEENLNHQTFNALVGPNLDMLSNRRGRYSMIGSWDNWKQVELANEFTIGGIEVKNLFGAQREELQYRNVLATTTLAFPNTQWLLSDQSTWVRSAADKEDFIVTPASGSTSTNYTDSFYFSNQLSMFEGRLRTLAGLRVDDFEVVAYNAANGTTTTTAAEPAKVPQLGALFKVTDDLAVYASYSESFLPVFSTSRRADGSFYSPQPQTGEGMDFGVKGSVMQGKLSYAAAIYEVSNTNIVRFLPPVTVGNETFSPTDQSGKETSRGFELDLRWQPDRDTQLIFSYGYTDAFIASDVQTRVTLNGQSVEARTGNRKASAPEHTAAFFARRDFGDLGALRKTYATFGGNYRSEIETSDTYFVYNNQLMLPWKIDGRAIFSLGFGGDVEIFGRPVKVSLNVNNLFDKDYLDDPYRYAPGRQIFLRLNTRF